MHLICHYAAFVGQSLSLPLKGAGQGKPWETVDAGGCGVYGRES